MFLAYFQLYDYWLPDIDPDFLRKKRLSYQSFGCSTIRNLEKKNVWSLSDVKIV
jgi:hypothetical protein